MISRPPLPEGPYLVVGLARSGLAAAQVLRNHSEVIAVDSAAPDVEEVAGVAVHLNTDGIEYLDSVRTVVKSPGVPRSAPVIAAALERGIPVTGELEIGWRLIANEFVAVTGTNGKTTTTELLGAIHREAGVAAVAAGNVGTPLTSLAGTIDPAAVVVAECSSFQLEDASAFAPECAVLVNLEADHLDRHRTVEAYREAKLRIFNGGGIAVIPFGFGLHTGRRVVQFGAAGAELEHSDGGLWWRGERLIADDEIRLPGAHNRENAMAASAAALARGIDAGAVRRALMDFAGVEHRLEFVTERNGVALYNDSKATNVGSTRVALEAFEGGVHLIAGGRAKGGGFGSLRDLVAQRCVAVYAIGEAEDELVADLDGAAPVLRCGSLADALTAAKATAKPGETILLSPASASYDQYRDYEERGAEFKRLVRE